MHYREKMTRWLLDTINTEIANPDGEADMGLVEECTALLRDLNSEESVLSERELHKRYRAIVRVEKSIGGKSEKKRIQLAAALAACLAVFVMMSSCGYLPSINVILQTIFASGVGKDVDVYEVMYTYDGNAVSYSDVYTLLESENLDITLPDIFPNDMYITNILHYNTPNLITITLNNPEITFQIYYKEDIDDFIKISECDVHYDAERIIYIIELSEKVYIAYLEHNNNIYCVQYSNLEQIIEILESIR